MNSFTTGAPPSATGWSRGPGVRGVRRTAGRSTRLFAWGGAFNVGFSLVPLLAPDLFLRIFFVPGAAAAGSGLHLDTQAVWFFILLFGFGYLWAARDPAPHRGVLWLGAIGKIYLFVAWSAAYLAGTTTWVALAGGTADLVWAVLFLRFLLREEEFAAVVRTPEERFRDLPGFPFAPHYLEMGGVRLHYLDEGEGDVILCLHGEPSWSYLYRKMIPILARRHRVIAPDFIGFGRSDKYTRRSDYTFSLHVDTLRELIRRLGIRRAVLVVQDWGGPVGLRVLASEPDLFTHLVVLNTDLPVADEKPTMAARCWRFFVKLDLFLPIGTIMQAGTVRRLPAAVVRAYRAPFPTDEYKQGAWAWPLLFPLRSTAEVARELLETRRALAEWNKPAAVMFSDRDPINSSRYPFFRRLLPQADGPNSTVVRGAGHFLQEDRGEEIATAILRFLDRHPGPRS